MASQISTTVDEAPSREWLVEFIAKYHGHPTVSGPQIDHRFRLVESFKIEPGHRILEIGCGQGDCTAALAIAVGEAGHITAVDPAPADYGSPMTVHQAQDLLSTSSLGPRISWIRAMTPIQYLAQNPNETWDVAVLAQSLWYFASPEEIRNTFTALQGRVNRVAVAEFSLRTSSTEAHAHVLAALTQGALALHDENNQRNIRTCVGPETIARLAKEAGFKLVGETFFTPAEEYQDARWEIGEVKSTEFAAAMESLVVGERERAYIETLRNAMLGAVKASQSKPRSMDIWVASFNV